MNSLLTLVVYMTVITWLTLIAASMIRTRSWTPQGMLLAFGNRDNLPEPSPLAGRAERTARNTMENFVLFTALALTAQVAGVATEWVLFGAQLFFWSRLAYIPIYLAGITFLRTAVWAVSIVGLVFMLAGMF